MQRIAILFVFALFSVTALAQSDNDLEMRRLTTLLDNIRQEQQSVYQQFQMTEALQRSELKEAETGPAMDLQEGRAPSYDDAVRAKQDRQTRLKYYAEEMRRLSDRYRELGNQGSGLVEEIRKLATPAR